MSFRPNDRPGRNDHAKLFAGYNDEGYLIPSTARLNFPPVFNFSFCFLDWGAQLPCSIISISNAGPSLATIASTLPGPRARTVLPRCHQLIAASFQYEAD